MADLLSTGLAWLRSQRHTHMTTSIVYARASDDVELNATMGRTYYQRADEEGFIRQVEARDFLIRREDLVINGLAVTPEDGDRITVTINGESRVYEVMSPPGEPSHRFSDIYNRTLRVHTKHVETEAA